jgi:hypothetical protein
MLACSGDMLLEALAACAGVTLRAVATALGFAVDGTVHVEGDLDLADAIDFNQAIAADAHQQLLAGSTESLDVRRSQAARHQPTLDLTGTVDATGERPDQPARRRTVRKVVLHLHLSDQAVRPGNEGSRGGGAGIGRVENTRQPVTADTIRDWCRRPDTQVVVKPVIDLADHICVDAYEVPDRIAEPVALRDLTCTFPWCTRPARTLRPDEHPCDDDHVTPYARGGPTCVCSIAPLCRRHHRLKTHGSWRSVILEPGSYLWTSPHGYQFLRDHHGTLDVSPDHRHPPAWTTDHPPGHT